MSRNDHSSVPSDNLIDGPDDFGRTGNQLQELYLQEHRAEYEAFVERDNKLNAVGAEFHNRNLSVQNERSKLQLLADQVAFASKVNVADSIFQTWLITDSGSLYDAAYKPNIFSAWIVKEFGPAVLKLQEAKVKDAEQTLKEFLVREKAVLTELGLI